MALIQTQCTIFKYNLLRGVENLTLASPYVYKIALYTANASLDESTIAYTTDGEVVGSGYTAGGNTLVVIPPAYSGSTAFVSFNNVAWTSASFIARGALIYNSTTGAAVAVLNFGADKTASGTFTVTFPTATSSSAVIRIA